MSSRVVRNLAAGSAVLVTLCAAPGVAAAHRWHVDAAAVPPGSNPSALLRGVSCPSTSSCVAVGSFRSDTVPGAALVERWDGASWTIQNAPDPAGGSSSNLQGVSCASATACEAVGYSFFADGFRPFAERWDGTSWTAQSVPFPAGEEGSLQGVSCASANDCVAVGREDTSTGSNAFVVHWDGTSWAIQTALGPPQTAELHGVSCSAATACTAVGDAGATREGGASATLAERWDGTAWTIQPSPSPAAVGDDELLGASCPSATACTAVGFSSDDVSVTSGPLVERWDASGWTIQATPTVADGAALNGVSCASAKACTAVGAGNFALGEGWDGRSWTLQDVPVPAGATLSALNGVSCTSANRCTAAGYYYDGSTSLPLIERAS